MSERLVLTVPEGLLFAELRLARDPVTGDISFDWRPIEMICAASGVGVAVFRDCHEDNVGGLLMAWYARARAAGEPADAVAEQLLAEVEAEDRYGQVCVQRGPGTVQ